MQDYGHIISLIKGTFCVTLACTRAILGVSVSCIVFQYSEQNRMPGSSCIGQTLRFVPHKFICFYHITTAFIDHVYE